MPLKLVTKPTAEPVNLDDVKSALVIEADSDDTYINTLIGAARRQAESFTRRVFVTQTWDWTLDEFSDELLTPLPPLQSVTSIQYIDTDGTTQTLAAANYKVDTNDGRIVEAYSKVWPVTRPEINAVTVRFDAGYGDPKDVPDDIKLAIILMVGHYIENREDSSPMDLKEIPFGSISLLSQYRMVSFESW